VLFAERVTVLAAGRLASALLAGEAMMPLSATLRRDRCRLRLPYRGSVIDRAAWLSA